MKFTIILFVAIIAIAIAAPLDDPKNAQILRYESDNIGVDGYNFNFETSDGIARQESAQLKNIGTEQEGIAVQGSATWIGDDGQQYTLNYIADENGFQPQGAHLPHT